MIVEVQIGKYFLEIPMVVAKICDDCLLQADFLEKINLGNIFNLAFYNCDSDNKNVNCA